MSKSIFDNEDNRVQGTWIKFKTPGDKFEGTLVAVRLGTTMTGNPQTIYDFLHEGQIHSFGSKPSVDRDMKFVKLGQIVGLEFVETKKSKTPGYADAKVIKVWANKDVVDTDWLNSQESVISEAANADVAEEEEAEEEETPADKFNADLNAGLTPTELKARIIAWGMKQGAENEAEAKTLAMDATGLALLPKNLLAILNKVEARA